ncbi:class I SAM-dependent methyltransferase [Methylocapsa palsarum]|uniref:Methyltransferase domain-containing protein n=1 Tax=Methylocapsa palsarum TaxID=1612308 RepID=A0A1I4BCP4_9HYPH|nr:class I SAM-dependent methyltransferase [Methylocapsa palsarum]SFK66564.1 Methyltransferase domain-containing protein [Methylocapsa palsarum]
MSKQQSSDFFDSWRTYRKVVDANYMYHAQFRSQIEALLLSEFSDHPFSLLDLGCGDAAILAPVLAAAAVSYYEGVDLSETALELAAQNLKILSCPVLLKHRDLLAALNDGDRQFDVIQSSFAVHHLTTDLKREFFAAAANRLSDRGILLLTDVVREEDESLPVYYQRYCDWLRRDWSELSTQECDAVCDHLTHYDHPETRSRLEEQARSAGFTDVAELARFGWHSMFRFGRNRASL